MKYRTIGKRKRLISYFSINKEKVHVWSGSDPITLKLIVFDIFI